jgi:pilus assembly protein Flp/PilA
MFLSKLLQKCKKNKNIKDDKSGITAIEYGLIAALIAVAIIAGVRSLGRGLSNTFSSVNSELAKGSAG